MADGMRAIRFGGIGQAFADRNFRIHSIGAFASWISFLVQIVAVSWLAWELTGSTVWLAVIALLDIVPNILLVPLGGVLADRSDRYRVMIVTNILLLLQAVAMALCAWLDLLTIWPLAGLVLLHGIILSFSVPAMYGMLPRFVAKSRLSSAIAVNSAYTQFAIFAGPALAGWIIAQYGITEAFVVNAIGYCILLGSQMMLRTPDGYRQSEASSHTVLRDIADGVSYILRHKGILALLLLLIAGKILVAGFNRMLPAYSEQIMGMDVTGMTIILTCIGLGATITALWIAFHGAAAVTFDRVLWGFLIVAIVTGMMMLTGSLYYLIPLAIVAGLAGEMKNTGTMTLIQNHVSDAHRGRVMGTQFMLSQFAAGIGSYFIGALAVSHGLEAPILACAGLCGAVFIVYFLRRKSLSNWFKNVRTAQF